MGELIGQSAPNPAPLIAVKMSPDAAEKLAKACGLAAGWAAELWDGNNVVATPERRARALAAYEWLGWAQGWLLHEGARVDLDAAAEAEA
jgi:hypothetical protein